MNDQALKKRDDAIQSRQILDLSKDQMNRSLIMTEIQSKMQFMNFNYLNRYKYLFNARKTRSLIFVQSIALLFSLAIILADSFYDLRIGSIFSLSMWVIVLSGLIHYLIFPKKNIFLFPDCKHIRPLIQNFFPYYLSSFKYLI